MGLPQGGSPLCHALPQCVIDDSEIGSVQDLPLLTRLLPLHALIRAGPPIRRPLSPNLFAEIPLVAQDPLRVMLRPPRPPRSRHIRPVQPIHDLRLGHTPRIQLEDLSDHVRLERIRLLAASQPR